MEGYRGEIVKRVFGFPIQRLDIRQSMRELQAGNAHFISREAIKHEGVIGVRAVRHRNFAELWSYGAG